MHVYRHRSLMKNDELKQDLIKHYSNELLFDPEATYALKIIGDLKVRDYDKLCTDNGFDQAREKISRFKTSGFKSSKWDH